MQADANVIYFQDRKFPQGSIPRIYLESFVSYSNETPSTAIHLVITMWLYHNLLVRILMDKFTL